MRPKISKNRILVASGLAAILLLIPSVVYWSNYEPSYAGKTITEWLDSLVLYTNEPSDRGVTTVHRKAREIEADPAFAALSHIGPRAIPTLVQCIQDRAEFPPDTKLSQRLKLRLKWISSRFGGAQSSGQWPKTQAARKTAAAFMLLVLSTNSENGFARLAETYTEAPRSTSVYGLRVSGAPVGFAPSSAVELACSVRPQIRDQILEGIRTGLQHTNSIYQSVAIDCARNFPELHETIATLKK